MRQPLSILFSSKLAFCNNANPSDLKNNAPLHLCRSSSSANDTLPQACGYPPLANGGLLHNRN
ncbi:MAG: hypothetical protein BGN96_04750 [Bacteroidales bacterium 45-6]|nr:MAG: hypothetical protein BGN96_04750 [Bacteroidales bacterium 45-6]